MDHKIPPANLQQIADAAFYMAKEHLVNTITNHENAVASLEHERDGLDDDFKNLAFKIADAASRPAIDAIEKVMQTFSFKDLTVYTRSEVLTNSDNIEITLLFHGPFGHRTGPTFSDKVPFTAELTNLRAKILAVREKIVAAKHELDKYKAKYENLRMLKQYYGARAVTASLFESDNLLDLYNNLTRNVELDINALPILP